MAEQNESLSDHFSSKAAAPSEFEYGWCKTDWKDGHVMHAHRTIDYMKDEPYVTLVRTHLEQMGLPFPKPEEIYRGSYHDLLFLNSHGVIIRIGPTNVEELMHPALIQPIGWLEDQEFHLGTQAAPLTVAIYGGVELAVDQANIPQSERPVHMVHLQNFLEETGQTANDLFIDNRGMVRIFDEERNEEVAVDLLIDVDNEKNDATESTEDYRKKKFNNAAKRYANKADAHAEVVLSQFSDSREMKYLPKAFNAHQPLRRLFWDAFKDVNTAADKPDPEKLKVFWDTCKRVTNNMESCVMPTWEMKEEKDASGNPVFVQKEIFVPNVVLYRPWTGNPEDKVIKPIPMTEELKEAVRKAHEEKFGPPKPAAPEPPPAPPKEQKNDNRFKRFVRKLFG